MSLLSRLAVSAARAYGALSSNPNAVSTSYLVVAGGGSGGGNPNAGGGGAGGLLTSTATLSILNTYSITVGAGGASVGVSNVVGNNGSNSVLSGTGLITVTATGGGGGGAGSPATIGNVGGSGGGSGYLFTSTPASGTLGQGNAGGSGAGNVGPGYAGGGGGGAGAVGGNGTSSGGTGAGGAGTASSISGSSVTYAGGGGGGNNSSYAAGGTGGGGASGVAGTANTGGGGGGHSNTLGPGGAATSAAGGSGVVIISYTSATPKFVGGTMSTINSGATQLHTFTSSGTLSPLTPVTASYLVVAGGGSGGSGDGGGGGAGGLLTSSTTIYSGATYVVTVGAGGAARSAGGIGNSGSNSSLAGTGLTTVTSTGGGGGGYTSATGASGGSGGGSSYGQASGGTGTSGQGNNGGGALTGVPYYGMSGGGGAGAVGVNGTNSAGGAGGAGSASSISGSSVTYAGGGGGAQGGSLNNAALGAGGTGGGGAAGNSNIPATAGTVNLGGGGGGGGFSVISGAGGSGTVIISYAGSQVFNGGLVTTSGGNTIHTFNATGALTPVTNNLNNSLRVRQSANGYLSRTPSSATNRRTWTWSGWVKLGTLGTDRVLFSAGSGATDSLIYIASGNTLYVNTNNATNVITNALLRDPSAWYHIVVAFDTTQATAANRVKVYINGNQQTFTGGGTLPTQNTDGGINNNIQHLVGGYAASPSVISYDGYMTDINFIDGQALEPYYFGNNDAYGNWKPILYKGMYGTNGFYLTFSDTSAATAAAIGKDSSGNGNNWTPSGISVTAGTTYDAMLDVPTNTSATVANYCTWNPILPPSSSSEATNVLNGNLQLKGYNVSYNTWAVGSIEVSSGKWYYEFTNTNAADWQRIGIISTSGKLNPTDASAYYMYYSANGNKISTGGIDVAYGNSWTTNDIIGVALDLDNGKIFFSKNGTWQASGDPAAGTNAAFTGLTGAFAPASLIGSAVANSVFANFGQRPFSYTPPTGFVRLNTYNLPTPTILQGNKYMDATLYTGNGSTQVIVNNAQFKPDFVWAKSRANAYNHNLYNSISGIDKFLQSNQTSAEATTVGTLTSFNSNGYTLGSQDNSNFTNGSTAVGWQWQAGQGTTTAGTGTGGITSVTQSVSTTAGFSVVQFTASGSNGTVTHGLGVAPSVVIVKDAASSGNWAMYHKSLPSAAYYLYMNTTAAQGNTALTWNSTAPTSSVFSIGTWHTADRQIAYCWAEIAGFSKFGSYTGNNSTDGPVVYLGFRPKFIMIKDATNVQSWNIIDSARVTYNVDNMGLYPNLNNAESANLGLDLLSNGFKFRTDGTTNGNASGATYIYMAFAENPFKNANAR